MKKISILSGIVAIIALAASCETKVEIQDDPVAPQSEKVTITADLSSALTKVTFTPGTDGSSKPILELTWKSGDKLRVADHADNSSYSDFDLDGASVGQKQGIFTGTPVSASSYDVWVVNEAINYADQAQPADADPSGLQYNASVEDITDLSNIAFTDVSSVLMFTAKNLPAGVAATIKSMDIKAFNSEGTACNIFDGRNSLKVTLAAAGDEGSDNNLVFYASLPKGSTAIPAGTSMLVKFNAPGEAHDVYTRYFTITSAVTLTEGKLNEISVGCANVASHAGAATRDGSTSAKSYLIGDKYQMTYIMNLYKAAEDTDATVNFFVELVDDINLSGVTWIPFNRAGTYKRQIDFDGHGHTISNLTVGNSYAYPSFAGVAYGSYKDFTIDSANINAGSNNTGVFAGYVGTSGTIIATCSGITVSNSTITAKATSNSRNTGGFAGVVGNADSSITNCHVTGSTTLSQTTTDKTGCSVGGFVGNVNTAAKISNCTAKADIINEKSYYVGGFIGQIGGAVAATITNCAYLGGTLSASRNATTNSPVGGFVGRVTANAGASFTNCYVDGAIITAATSGRCGGFVGDSGNYSTAPTTFAKCYVVNTSVTAAQHIGGFAGVLYTNVDKCYVDNTTLTATSYPNVGGFVGYPQNAGISNCYVTSGVTVAGGSNNAIGGFVGCAMGGNTVTNCYEAAVVTGSAAGVGAFIGYLNTAETSVTKNVAWDGSLNFCGDKKAEVDDSTITGNYLGTSGTISSQATALGWDGSIWNLSGSVPTLK